MKSRTHDAFAVEIPVIVLKRLVKKAERSSATLLDFAVLVDADAPVFASWRNHGETHVTGGLPIFEADIIPTTVGMHTRREICGDK